MDCDTAKSQLGLYLDRALPSEDRAALDAHLTACSRCTRELAEMTEMVSALVPQTQASVPAQLWSAIEGRLHGADRGGRRTFPLRVFRFPPALAASVLFVIGAGIFAASWIGGGAEAAAAPIDFGVLLDALPLDANRAFVRFLTRYGARRVSPVEAKKYAPGLNFELPEALPGGFTLEEVFALRFGGNPGIAARYSKNGELLGAIFHPPVGREQYGTHKDYSCVIGQHRGHQVSVGEWKLVHVTDPTTCHCVLSKLDQSVELPAVMRRLVPDWPTMNSHHHPHAHRHGSGD